MKSFPLRCSIFLDLIVAEEHFAENCWRSLVGYVKEEMVGYVKEES